MNEAVQISEQRCILGESPLWSVEEQALYWVDIQNPTIYRYDPASGERRKWLVESEIGSFGFAGAGKLIAGLRLGFALYDLESNSYEVLADPEGDGRLNRNRLNDGKADRAGRYWCGSMQDPGHGPVGTLYRLDPDHSCHAIGKGFRIPNALCWSPDDKTMYYADSATNCIWAYDYDLEMGHMSNRRVFAEVPTDAGHPDGATVDSEGFLWSAQIFGGRVTRYDPEGVIERVIELPTPRVTCCCFGGPDLDILYVTTASMRMSREELAAEPLAGHTFAVEVGVKGLPEPNYGG